MTTTLSHACRAWAVPEFRGPLDPIANLQRALTHNATHGGAEDASDLFAAAGAFLDHVEFDAFDFGDREDDAVALVEALFWAFTDCHSGQWSEEYALACRCGAIYQPGPMMNGPEEDTSAEDYYRAACALMGCDDAWYHP